MTLLTKAFAPLALAATALTAPAHAVEIVGGDTDVTLDAAPTLAELGLDARATGTATVTVNDGIPTFTFPITGGEIEDGNALIEHDGSGLELFNDSAVLSLSNFLIDTEALLVSGNVSANGMMLGVVPLFNIGSGLSLSLTEASSGAINTVFGVQLAPGTVIGTANPQPLTAAVPEPGTWALLLFGFAAVGFSMRAGKRRQNVSVSYA